MRWNYTFRSSMAFMVAVVRKWIKLLFGFQGEVCTFQKGQICINVLVLLMSVSRHLLTKGHCTLQSLDLVLCFSDSD